MKKKFLIVIFTLVAACVLAFSVSAANEVTLTDGTTADFTTVFKVNANNQVTGFNTGYDKNTVSDVIFPDEIEGIEANYLFNSSTGIKTLIFAATDTFFISGDGIFSNCSVEKIIFDPNCVVELRKGNFSGCTSLTEITFPKFKKLAGSAFKNCSNMKSTNELIFAEGMTEIGGHVFNGCTSLTGTVYFPSTLEKIQEYSFQNTGFTNFDLSKCVNLTLVGGGYGGPFTDNDNITRLDMSACVKLTTIEKGNLVANSDNLEEVILPPNLTNIPSKAFAHCYKLQSIVFPASMKTVADEAFHSARRNQEVMTFTVYIQSDVQMGVSYPFRDSGAKIEYVLIGDDVTAESFKAANTFSGVTGATVVDYLDSANPYSYTVGQTLTAHTIVDNYCKSLALNGEHAFKDNPCATVCSNCDLSTPKDEPVHNETVSITYANGYGSVGTKLITCTNEGCKHIATEKAKVLFNCLGYSAPENGDGEIAIGFTVNSDAIKEYEKATGKTIKYGIFAAAQTKIGNSDIFGSDETDAISVEVSKEYIAFDLVLSGFTDTNKNIKLAIGAYVATTKGDNTEYSYIQDGTPNDGDKYVFDSYNDVINALSSDTTEQ